MGKHLLVGLVCMLLLLAAAPGCTPEPPPPPPPETPPPPPEPTPEQHHATMKGNLSALFAEGGMGPDVAAALVASFNGMKMQMSATDNGRAALGMIQRDIEDGIRSFRQQNRWVKVKACCELYKILQPGSDRYAKAERDAELMMARPTVVVTGFMKSGSEIYSFLSVTNPETQQEETFKIREGEEFYRPAKVGSQENDQDLLRLVRIIGDQQSVELEYKPVNFLWECPGPRKRQS